MEEISYLERTPEKFAKCSSYLESLTYTFSMYQVFKGSEEELTSATEVLAKCCEVLIKQSVILEELKDNAEQWAIDFVAKLQAYIRAYCRELIVTYANLLQEVFDFEKED